MIILPIATNLLEKNHHQNMTELEACKAQLIFTLRMCATLVTSKPVLVASLHDDRVQYTESKISITTLTTRPGIKPEP